MKRQLTLFFVLLGLTAFACGGSEDDAGAQAVDNFPLTVESVAGELILQEPAQRIASLSAHATEILCSIGAGEQLIAVDSFANCPAEGGDKTELDSFQPNLEAIVGLEPDLVVVVFDPSGLVGSLQRLGVPVLFLDLPLTLEGVLEQVELFGSITARPDEAAQLRQAMQKRIDDVSEDLAEVESGPRIFHELTIDYFTAGPDSFIGDFYRLLKAENIAAGTGLEYPQLTAEVILERNPQVIILADEAEGVDAETVRSRPGWQVIEAVQNDRICVIDPDIVSRPGPRVVDALDALAACIYPDLFQEP